MAMDERRDLVSQKGAPGHPLEVGAAAMMVGTVKAATGEGSLDPAERCLVTYVHPERYLSLTPVTAEVSLARQQSDQEAHGERVCDLDGGRLADFRMHVVTVAGEVVSP